MYYDQVVGIIGGGQLAKMLAIAASEMGVKTIILDPADNPPAKHVATNHIQSNYDDVEALIKFAQQVDVITLEFENIPLETAEFLEKYKPLRPSSKILAITQNRLNEKKTCSILDIPTAKYHPVYCKEDLIKAFNMTGKGILKTSTGGYDGKHQYPIKDIRDIDKLEIIDNLEYIYESFIAFKQEVSVIVARNDKDTVFFPIVENIHCNGILHKTIAPAHIEPRAAKLIESYTNKIIEYINLFGILTIEFFIDNNDNVLVNELAPRVHNSGHYSIEACATSQFKQAIYAILNMPLGSTRILTPAMMINLIGEDILHLEKYQKSNSSIHIYGKSEIKKGRKMGHVTILDL